MSKVIIGPVGSLVRGNVLDVAVKPFVETMRFTLNDPLLYVKWNPKKLQGHGCWEIRRRPENLSAVDATEYNGDLYLKLDYKEYDWVHHVLDCAFLNYDAIRKLKEMDTWQHGGTVQDLEDVIYQKTRDRQEREREQRKKDLAYMVKHYKREINLYKEMIRDGNSPTLIANNWNSVKEAD